MQPSFQYRFAIIVAGMALLSSSPGAWAMQPRPPGVLPFEATAFETRPAQMDITFKMDLPEQALADSLQAIARMANFNLLVDPGLTADRTAPALRGRMSASAALRRMLRGTGLVPRYVDERTLILVFADPVATPPGR